MQTDESKQVRSAILLVAMIMSVLLVVVVLIIGYFQEQIMDNSLYSIFLLLPAFSITIQALVIFFFIKQSDMSLNFLLIFL